MFNFLVSQNPKSWNSKPYQIDKSRVAIEFTNDKISEKYKSLDNDAIKELMSFPSLFATEVETSDSRIGYINKIKTKNGAVVIEYKIDPIMPPIPAGEIAKNLMLSLDIDRGEMYRTHWAVKDENLFEVLSKHGYITEENIRDSATLRNSVAGLLTKEPKDLQDVKTGAKTIFISHANEDAALARAIKTQLDNVFENKVRIFVSSITISPGSDWFDKILGSLTENDAFIVLVTPYSEKRPFVWFEIGFSWLRRLNKNCEIYAICAPPINHGKLPEPLCRLQAISLADKEKTTSFFEKLTKQFKLGNLDRLDFAKIHDLLPTYLSQITQSENIDISDEAKELLIEASTDKSGYIVKVRHSGGTFIKINDKNMVPSQEARIIAKWEHALDELVENDFVEEKGYEGSCFQITHQGYEYADTLKKELHITNVLQGKSSVDSSASIEQNDLTFDPKTGTYTSENNDLRYCSKCFNSTPSKDVPLREQDNGWTCGVCDKFYRNPNYNPPTRGRDNLGPMAV